MTKVAFDSNWAEKTIMSSQPAVSHVMCVDNVGFEASLEKRKVYLCTADPLAAREGLLSVVDESGETYLLYCPTRNVISTW